MVIIRVSPQKHYSIRSDYVRLDKLLSNLKYGSRTEIKSFVKKGLITVNGKVLKDSNMDVNPEEDQITFNGEVVYYKETIILAMHKPAGYLSANEDKKDPVVIALLKKPYD